MQHFNDMTPPENLCYALGELAYAIAFADGSVQNQEREKFQQLLSEELKGKTPTDVASIVFKLMEKKNRDSKTVYEWAINEVKINSHYLSPELKNTFISVIEKVAQAFPPVTNSERKLLEQFRKDIAPLHGDPVYYGKT